MTFARTAWAWDQELPCAPKFILVTLSDIIGMDETYDVNFDRLGFKCGLARDEICAAFGYLEGAGHCKIWEITPSIWRVTLFWPDAEFPAEDYSAASKDDALKRCLGWIYLCDTDHGICKIGITTDLPARSRSLETSAALPVRIVWSQACDITLARKIERAILLHFSDARAKGEWMRVAASEVQAVAHRLLGEAQK